MSKTNKGGYQILDMSKVHLKYDDWNEGYLIGEVYPVFNIARQPNRSTTISTAERFEFSNRIVEEFFNILMNVKKPILITNLTLYDDVGAIEAEFKDMFIAIPPIPPINPTQFSNLTVPLPSNYFLHIYATHNTVEGTSLGVNSLIKIIINQEE